MKHCIEYIWFIQENTNTFSLRMHPIVLFKLTYNSQ